MGEYMGAQQNQQNQRETKNQSKVISGDTSTSAAPKVESAATLQPLLQEVVAKDEPDEEAFALQRALAESLWNATLIRLSQGRSQSQSHSKTYSRGQSKKKPRRWHKAWIRLEKKKMEVMSPLDSSKLCTMMINRCAA